MRFFQHSGIPRHEEYVEHEIEGERAEVEESCKKAPVLRGGEGVKLRCISICKPGNKVGGWSYGPLPGVLPILFES